MSLPLLSPNVPDVAGCATGYRFWAVRPRGWPARYYSRPTWLDYSRPTCPTELLTGVGIGVRSSWPPREPLVARCLNCCSSLQPVLQHTCYALPPGPGIYGLKHAEVALESFRVAADTLWAWRDRPAEAALQESRIPGASDALPCLFLFGKVYLWGAVAEHELGYRAEYAYPAEFYDIYWPPQYRDLLEYLSQLYRVPVVPLPA